MFLLFRLTDKAALAGAVKQINKRRREDEQEEDREQQNKKKRQEVPCKLTTQKYLREIRTRNGQLRKLAGELK